MPLRRTQKTILSNIRQRTSTERELSDHMEKYQNQISEIERFKARYRHAPDITYELAIKSSYERNKGEWQYALLTNELFYPEGIEITIDAFDNTGIVDSECIMDWDNESIESKIEALEAFRYLSTEFLKDSPIAFKKALQKFGFKMIENDELKCFRLVQ